jgi:type IV pilus assembly protein PilB
MVREYRSLSGPKSLGDRLLEAGLITRTQLDVALDHQRAASDGGQRLGRTLVQLGFLSDRDLIPLLSVHLGIPVAPFSIVEAEERAVTSVPAGVARRHRAVPWRVVSGCLLVAVADAPTSRAVEELQVVSGHPVLLYLVSEADIDGALLNHYGHGSSS